MTYDFTTFCDLEIFTGTRKEFVDLFVSDREADGPAKIVFSVNGQGLSDYHTDEAFRKPYARADYLHADGMSIVFGTRLFGRKSCRERIATTDWFHDIVQDARCRDVRHFLLGAEQSVLDKTVAVLEQTYPHMIIAGAHHGYFTPEEAPAVVARINAAKADILWVALGRPKQEAFAAAWYESLDVVWIKTCGGLFDFISGKSSRAPQIIQDVGLEWAYRLFREPKRLLWRYLKTNTVSLLLMLREGIRNLVNSSSPP